MPAKDIKFEEEARNKIAKGAKKLASAVRVTLGPMGRNVLIQNSFGNPHITKDGVTVAKAIDELEDKHENLGAQMLKEVASKTADKAGDGTTTATVLGYGIYSEGLRVVAAGANPMELKIGMELAGKAIVENLKTTSKPIQDAKEITQVATISANGDDTIGKMIAEAMDRVGKDGVITVEEAKTFETTLKVVQGMNFDRGYLSSCFVTNSERLEVEYDEAYVLIYEEKISSMKDFLPILQSVAETSKPLLIIAEDIEGEALATLVLNRLRAGLKVCAIKAPGFGDRRKAMMEDIAILTGAELISEKFGISLKETTVDMLGKVKRVIVKKEETTLVDGYGDPAKIEERIAQIRAEHKASTSNYDKEKLAERLAKLTGGIGVIAVGGHSEVEVGERKDRVDDALSATRAAVEGGILPGGGTALIRCIESLKTLASNLEGDQRTGVELVMRSLSLPLRQIATNAGKEGSIIVEKVLSMKGAEGYNAKTAEFVDMYQSGVIDPTKVTISGIENAISVVGMFLSTAVSVTEREDEDKAAAPAAPAMPPMGY
ncbi:MAG: chaperonin GroEL [Chlamydiota bacterium]